MIGASYGSSQDWLTDPLMKLGGCGAVTACDSSIYFAMHLGRKDLCPIDVSDLTKESFRGFTRIMKPYLRPRFSGINRTSIYASGAADFFREVCGAEIPMSTVEGSAPYPEAEAAVIRQIDHEIPIPYLMLMHRDPALKDFNWHWFLLNGYKWEEGRFFVRAVTYSAWTWLDFAHLWDTGFDERGGFVLYEL